MATTLGSQFGRLQHTRLAAILVETWDEWGNDDIPRLGAALAFYTLLSLAPLLVIVVTIAGFVFGPQAARGQLVWEIQDLVGADRAKTIQAVLQSAYRPGQGIIASVLGFITLVLGASSVVVELQDALNTIWDVPRDTSSTGISAVVRLIKDRFLSFALILGAGCLLLISVILNTWLSAMGRFFSAMLSTSERALHAAGFVIPFLIITLLFAAIYKVLPDVRLKWSEVLIGGAISSLLFSIGQQIIGWYLARASLSSTYGAAGSVVMILVWVYYSAQLFLLGAEFTKAYVNSRPLKPAVKPSVEPEA